MCHLPYLIFVFQVKPSVEGTFTVTAHDLCLEVKSPAKATVVVSDVYQIQLTVVDKVCIYTCTNYSVQSTMSN